MLGYVGPLRRDGYYGIWAWDDPEPIMRFPLSSEGWEQAWNEFIAEEPNPIEAEGDTAKPEFSGPTSARDKRRRELTDFGDSHLLGYVPPDKGRHPGFHAIWRRGEGQPIARFPYTTAGQRLAMDAFREREPTILADVGDLDSLGDQHDPGIVLRESESITSKECPACAETVKAAARVCRFCGYEFSRGRLSPLSSVPETNGFAVASFVLGCLGIAILALIFGYVGKGQIDSSGGAERGRGFAIAGIVLGWIEVSIVVLIILTVVIYG